MMRKVKTALTACLILAAASGLRAQEIFVEEGNLYRTRELKSSIAAAVHGKVMIKSALSLQGELNISTWDEESAKVVYSKKAKADKRSDAIDYIDLIAVNLEKVPDGIRLTLKAPNPAPWKGMEMGLVSVELYLPESCEVEIDAQYFDIEAVGPFTSFVVPSSLGRLTIAHVTEELDVSTSNRRVSVENISGEISVTTANSDLEARNIKGSDSRAVFRNDSGDIRILGISGEINVKSSYGRITIDGFAATGKKNYVRGLYGPIAISLSEMGDGQLVMSNRYEDIELTLPSDVSAVLSLAVEEDGQIEVSNLPVKPDLVQRNRLNLVVGDGDALITGSVRGEGNVYIRGQDRED